MAARKRRPSQSGKNGNLRAKADKLGAKNPDSTKAIAAPDIQKLVLELQVHQVELEMQNDELRQAQVEIEESRARYVDLYDFSPVG